MAKKIHRAQPHELPLSRRDLHRCPAGAHRQLVNPDDMIAHAIAEKWIGEETETDGTALYYPGKNRPA
jgi:hypothetical protein